MEILIQLWHQCCLNYAVPSNQNEDIWGNQTSEDVLSEYELSGCSKIRIWIIRLHTRLLWFYPSEATLWRKGASSRLEPLSHWSSWIIIKSWTMIPIQVKGKGLMRTYFVLGRKISRGRYGKGGSGAANTSLAEVILLLLLLLLLMLMLMLMLMFSRSRKGWKCNVNVMRSTGGLRNGESAEETNFQARTRRHNWKGASPNYDFCHTSGCKSTREKVALPMSKLWLWSQF